MSLNKRFFQRALKNTIGTASYYFLRDLYNKKGKYLYNKDTYAAISDELKRRNGKAIANDIEFMNFLHGLFPPFPKVINNLADLQTYARSTLDEIGQHDIHLRDKRIIDIGCGSGEMLFVVANEYGAKSAVGVDFDHKNKARFDELFSQFTLGQTNKIQFIVSDFLACDFDQDNFDLAISIASFEHYDDPSAVLEKCHSIVKPGGYLFTSFDPLFYSPLGAHRYLTTGIPYHQILFSDKTVHEFFSDKRKDNDMHPGTEVALDKIDPYPEMNRWTPSQFDALFLSSPKWEVLSYRKRYQYQYSYFKSLFPDSFASLSDDDTYCAGITAVLRKKS